MRSSLLLLTTFLLGVLQVTPSQDASISGRVKDSYGAVLPTGIISVGTLGYRDGRRAFVVSTVSTSQFDGYGSYRVSPVKPGQYYVRVEGGVLRGVPTYYPGTLDVDAATTISVQAGQEVVGIDFDLISAPTYKVSGTVLNIPARLGPNGQPDTSILGFTFSSANSRSPDTGAPLLQTATRGNTFEISLPPGLWDLFPVIPLRAPGQAVAGVVSSSPPTYATGRARVLVKDRDVENVVVNVTSATIKGRILVSGSSPGENNGLSVIRIGLLPKENYPSPLLSHVRSQGPGTSGDFTFNDVPPGKYAFQVSPIPAGLYLADIRVGSKSIYDDGVLNVKEDPIDPVEIVLSRRGGTVRLSVTGTFSEPGSLRGITLVPAPPRRGNAILYRTLTYPDTPASAVFEDVAPGRYKVFAFQSLPPGGAEQNSEFMASYENSGTAIDVVPGQTVDVPLRWIPPVKP